MDFYTYFTNWRKAYHTGRVIYHQTMVDFYNNQSQAMDLWYKTLLKGYEAMIGMAVMKNLNLFKPDTFGAWK